MDIFVDSTPSTAEALSGKQGARKAEGNQGASHLVPNWVDDPPWATAPCHVPSELRASARNRTPRSAMSASSFAPTPQMSLCPMRTDMVSMPSLASDIALDRVTAPTMINKRAQPPEPLWALRDAVLSHRSHTRKSRTWRSSSMLAYLPQAPFGPPTRGRSPRVLSAWLRSEQQGEHWTSTAQSGPHGKLRQAMAASRQSAAAAQASEARSEIVQLAAQSKANVALLDELARKLAAAPDAGMGRDGQSEEQQECMQLLLEIAVKHAAHHAAMSDAMQHALQQAEAEAAAVAPQTLRPQTAATSAMAFLARGPVSPTPRSPAQHFGAAQHFGTADAEQAAAVVQSSRRGALARRRAHDMRMAEEDEAAALLQLAFQGSFRR